MVFGTAFLSLFKQYYILISEKPPEKNTKHGASKPSTNYSNDVVKPNPRKLASPVPLRES